MSQSKHKQPHSKVSVEKSKQARSTASSNDTELCCWRLGRLDIEHPRWGLSSLKNEATLLRIHDKLKSYETRTWNEIKKDTGGKSSGNMSHEIPISELSKEAQKELSKLNLDDIDSLYSLRIGGKERLWGWKNGYCLEIIWYDSNHEVYPLN